MPYARKKAIIASVTWALVLGGLIASVLSPGASKFVASDHSDWRLLAAAIILLGYAQNAWLGWRSKRGRRLQELDERDDAIARRASETTLIVVTAVVFLTSIILYETHMEGGTVPTGWLFLIAYGTVSLVSLTHAVATLILDWSGSADG